MTCAQAKSLFSPYLDGAVTGTQMHAISQHLQFCALCRREYISLQQTQQLLAKVGSNGRVQDYRILSNPTEAKSLLPQVKNMLIFTTFRPATSMGRPTSGRAVLSFSKISVRG